MKRSPAKQAILGEEGDHIIFKRVVG